MNPTPNARRLRREQTDEEKQLWRELRGRRFSGFKFRRQHPAGTYFLDVFCAQAGLAVELDGFQHGVPEQTSRDEARERFLADEGIEVLRFWNHQWHESREGCLLKIWNALHRRTGCVQVLKKVEEPRYIPPDPEKLWSKPASPKERGGQ